MRIFDITSGQSDTNWRETKQKKLERKKTVRKKTFQIIVRLFATFVN